MKKKATFLFSLFKIIRVINESKNNVSENINDIWEQRASQF